MTISYDARSGRYRDKKTGKFTTKAKLLGLVSEEVSMLETRLGKIARSYNSGKISSDEFEQAMAVELKYSHIRMGALGVGGVNNLDKNSIKITERNLDKENIFLERFVYAIATEELSEEQIVARAKLYAQSSSSAYHRAEYYQRISSGMANEAKRTLALDAKHCPQCPALSTQDNWVDIEKVVPIGSNCDCRGRCRCSIAYRYNFKRDPLNPQSMQEIIIGL